MPEANGGEGLSPEPDHLEGLTIAEPAGAAGDNPVSLAGAPQVFTKDQFFQNFVGVHALAGTLTKLQSLAIADKEKDTARAASDAIYDIAADTPWLRFLIEPSNIWLQRAMAIGAFAVPKAMAVRIELAARRPAKGQKPGGDAVAANDPMAAFPKDVKA